MDVLGASCEGIWTTLTNTDHFICQAASAINVREIHGETQTFFLYMLIFPALGHISVLRLPEGVFWIRGSQVHLLAFIL